MPDWKSEIEKRLAVRRIEPAPQPEVVQELVQHLEDRYAELLAGGMEESAARQAVVTELEDLEHLPVSLPSSKRERAHEGTLAGAPSSGHLLADFARDLRHGWRVTRRAPLFALFAVLSLGVGIGANTTVFTIVNTLLLHPLPARAPSRLVVLYDALPQGTKRPSSQAALSYANLQDYLQRQRCFQDAAVYTTPLLVTLAGKNGPERMFGELVGRQYFETLGLEPALGRFFLPSEDSETGSAPVAVLSYNAWQGRFGGAPNVLGRTLELDNVAFTVVGVAPKGFLGLSAIFGPDVWLPATMAEKAFPAEFHLALSDRSKPLFRSVARLHEGFSIRRAQANLDLVAGALAREYPATNEGHGIQVRPVTDELYSSASGSRGLTFASGVLFTVVLLVLGIACSNVANLLLARAAARRQEIGLRLALGAHRGRLVRQLLAESAVLSLASGIVGLGLGYVGCRLVWSLVPTEYVQNLVAPRLDGGVVAFAVLLSLFTTILFGLVPALRASHLDFSTTLREDTPGAGRSTQSQRFTRVLLVGQVAFSLLCLVTSALFFRSIERAYTIDPGFQTDHLALVMTNPSQAGYDSARTRTFYRSVRERISTLPGVVSVSWASGLPFWNGASRSVVIEGAEPRKVSATLSTVAIVVDTDYFTTMGIPLVAGRTFSDSDREDSLPVAIINQALAGQPWPGGNPLGQRFHFTGDNTWRTVVGVARNADYSALGEAPQPCVYLPQRQNFAGGMTLYVRSRGNPAGLLPVLQREIRSQDSTVEVSDARTGRKLIDQVLWAPKVGVGLLGVFGSLALVLASVGLYGVMAYSVSRRRREIGVRMALGAPRAAVLRLIIADGMVLVGCGIAFGLAASLLVGRLLSRMLFGISFADPVSLISACLTLFAVALTACYLPARSATRIDPMAVLRDA